MDVLKDLNELGFAYFPPAQLAIYLGVLLLCWAYSRFEIGAFVDSGLQLFMLWVVVACFMGVSTDVSWGYYPLLIGSLLLAFAAYFGVISVSGKLGRHYGGELSLALMCYLIFPMNVLAASMIVKLVWQWVYRAF